MLLSLHLGNIYDDDNDGDGDGWWCRRAEPPLRTVLFINLLWKGLTARVCMGDGDSPWWASDVLFSWMKFWLSLRHYHMYFCWVVPNHVSRVVPMSENAVYKSAVNLLMKSIRPQIILFLKRKRPTVRDYSLKGLNFVFGFEWRLPENRVISRLKPVKFSFFSFETILLLTVAVKKNIFKSNLISFHYTP